MTVEQLTITGEMPGIKAVQVQRGTVDHRNAYSQWNLCDYTGDDALRVLDARLVFCQLMGIDLDQLVMPRQTHTTHVAVIDQNYLDADIEGVDNKNLVIDRNINLNLNGYNLTIHGSLNYICIYSNSIIKVFIIDLILFSEK